MIPDRLNIDYHARVLMHGADLPWIPSPLAGVERRLLYRLGGEKARATSLVRYAPGSHFSKHVHSGGEEFLVLQGVFEDEHGSYPAGTYVRNPPGSHHSPKASQGCMIFVRLMQFHPLDQVQLVVQLPTQGSQILFENDHEWVAVQDLPPHSHVTLSNRRGLELLVIEGGLMVDGQALKPLDWLRLPANQNFTAQTGKTAARFWVKDTDHTLGL